MGERVGAVKGRASSELLSEPQQFAREPSPHRY